ncbi:unnamed protein product [Brassica oleracea]
MVKSLLQKPNRYIVFLWVWMTDNHALNEFCRYSCGCAVPSTCKDYGKKITAGLIFSSHWTQHSGNCVLTECIALVLFSAAYMPYILHNLCFKNNDARGEDLEAGGGGIYH